MKTQTQKPDDILLSLLVGFVCGRRTVRRQDLRRRRAYFHASRKQLLALLSDEGELHCCIPGCTHGDLVIHHVIPLALGGTNQITNLRIVCGGHHAIIHGQTVESKKEK